MIQFPMDKIYPESPNLHFFSLIILFQICSHITLWKYLEIKFILSEHILVPSQNTW